MEVYETKPAGKPHKVQMLTRYKAWADALAFRNVMALPREEVVKERKAYFKTIAQTLAHTYIVDDMFKAHLEGRTHGYTSRKAETPPALDALWGKVQKMDTWYVELADSLSQNELDEVITFKFVEGGEGAMSREDILLHVVNHTIYHQGFVSTMMHEIPANSGANDLPVFLRDVWYEN